MASTLHRAREGFFSAECSYGRNWKVDELKGRRGSLSWVDDAPSSSTTTTATSSSSSSSSSLASPMPVSNGGIDGTVDKVLYQNLVEMIPLVETFMDRRKNKAFTRQRASLIYTPTPSRESLPLTKMVEHHLKGVGGSGQLPRCKRGGSKGSKFCDSTENMHFGTYPDKMLSMSKDQDIDPNEVNIAIIARLQSQIEQLELMLHEKENQLSHVLEKSSRQDDILCLETRVEELQNEMVEKNQELEKGMELLTDKQNMITSLCSRLEEAEVEVQASNLNVEKVHEELHNLQCQIATFLVQMQRISLSIENEPQIEDSTNSIQAKENLSSQKTDVKKDQSQMEQLKRKYLASIIVARHNPSDELILLVAELRGQLHSYLIKTDMIGHLQAFDF